MRKTGQQAIKNPARASRTGLRRRVSGFNGGYKSARPGKSRRRQLPQCIDRILFHIGTCTAYRVTRCLMCWCPTMQTRPGLS
jgi:hypothetical protein